MAFARDFGDLPGAKRLVDSHENYLIAVTRSLLDRAVEEGQIAPADTAALAHVLGGLGREFTRPQVARSIAASPKQTADAITEIILQGLTRSLIGRAHAWAVTWFTLLVRSRRAIGSARPLE